MNNKLLTIMITAILMASSVVILTACSEDEQEVELMGISHYSRTQNGELMEYDISNHQINENGQITAFDVHRTNIEQVDENNLIQEHVDSDESAVILARDDDGNIVSAKTEVPGLGYQMYEMTYKDGLIDTNKYSTDWGGSGPYTIQNKYEKENGIVKSKSAECIDGVGSANPEEYTYNDNGDVERVMIDPESEAHAYLEVKYGENGNITKITNFNSSGAFLEREFEYISLGQKVKSKAGFFKWQEFDVIDNALQMCN